MRLSLVPHPPQLAGQANNHLTYQIKSVYLRYLTVLYRNSIFHPAQINRQNTFSVAIQIESNLIL